jgi:hypothetical protein
MNDSFSNNPSPDGEEVYFERLRLSAERVKGRPLEYKVAYLLEKENPTCHDILSSLQDLEVNDRDYAFFLDDSGYKLLAELYRKGQAYRKQGLSLPTQDSIRLASCTHRVRELKKDFLTNAADEFFKAEITTEVQVYCYILGYKKVTEQEALDILEEEAPEQAKVYARINAQHLAKINYGRYDEILKNAMIKHVKSSVKPRILECLRLHTKGLYFPILTLQYEKKGVECVNWAVKIYVLAEQEMRPKEREDLTFNGRTISIEFKNL